MKILITLFGLPLVCFLSAQAEERSKKAESLAWEKKFSFTTRFDVVQSVAISSDGKLLAVASTGHEPVPEEGAIEIFDLLVPTKPQTLPLPTERSHWIRDLVFDEQGVLYGYALLEYATFSWDVAKGKSLEPLKGIPSSGRDMAINQRCTTDDQPFVVMEGGKLKPTGWCDAVILDRRGRQLATPIMSRAGGGTAPITDLAFGPNFLAAVSASQVISLVKWTYAGGQTTLDLKVYEIPLKGEFGKGVTVSPDGKIAVITNKGSVWLVDPQADPLKKTKLFSSRPGVMVQGEGEIGFSKEGDRLFVSIPDPKLGDRLLKVWDVSTATPRPLPDLITEGGHGHLAVGPDDHIAVWEGARTVNVYALKPPSVPVAIK